MRMNIKVLESLKMTGIIDNLTASGNSELAGLSH